MADTKIIQHEVTRNRIVDRDIHKRKKSRDGGTIQAVDEKRAEKARVLVVDEPSGVRQGLTRLINEQPGFVVVAEAENAEQALDILTTQQVDMVLVDRSLGEAGPAGLTEKIKSNCPHVPVFVLPVAEFLEQ